MRLLTSSIVIFAVSISAATATSLRSKRQYFGSSACDSNCDADTSYDPVCDSWSRTQPNNCYYEKAKCKAALIGTTLGIKYRGPCQGTVTTSQYLYDSFGNPIQSGQAVYPSSVQQQQQQQQQQPGYYSFNVNMSIPDRPNANSLPTPPPFSTSFSNFNTGSSGTCNTPCPFTSNPVCDQNGKPYLNDCYFTNAQCLATQRGSSLTKQSCVLTITIDQDIQNLVIAGPDPSGSTECENPCGRYEYNPVCDNEGRKYYNQCYLGVAQCYARRRGRTLREVPCDNTGTLSPVISRPSVITYQQSEQMVQAVRGDECFKACTKDYRPVCDSTGTTHNNECMFQVARCWRVREGNADIQILLNQACTSDILNRILQQPLTLTTQNTNSVLGWTPDTMRPFTPFQPIALPLTLGSTGQQFQQLVSSVGAARTCPLQSNSQGVVTVDLNSASNCLRNKNLDQCRNEMRPACASDGCTYMNQCHVDIRACMGVAIATLCSDRRCENCPSLTQSGTLRRRRT